MGLRLKLKTAGSVAVTLGVIAASVVVFGAGTAQAAESIYFSGGKIGSFHGMCLDWGGRTENVPDRTPVRLNACEEHKEQNFGVYRGPHIESYALAGRHGDDTIVPKCLDLAAPNTGAKVVLNNCDSNSVSQRWTVATVHGVIISGRTGDCLQPAASGTDVIIGPCTGDPDQLWSAWDNNRFMDVPPAQSTSRLQPATPVRTRARPTGVSSWTYVWSARNLPPGISIDSRAGESSTAETSLFGTPTVAGSYLVTVSATDNGGRVLEESFWWTVTPALVTVPNVIGFTRPEALDTLQALGFVVTIGYSIATCEELPGHVVSTEPGPGARVEPGSGVVLHRAVKPANGICL